MTGNELTLDLRKYLLRRVEPKALNFLDDAELLSLYNGVLDDFVSRGSLLFGHYFREDVNDINIPMQGKIVEVQELMYYGEDVRHQYWAIAEGNIIAFKYKPAGATIEIIYSRTPSEIIDMDDAVDLPENLTRMYAELVKLKSIYDFNLGGNLQDYEVAMDKYVRDAQIYIEKPGLYRPRKYWLGLSASEIYDISDRKKGSENLIRDVNDGLWYFA